MARQISERVGITIRTDFSSLKASMAKIERAAKRTPSIAKEVLAIDDVESLFTLRGPDGINEQGEMVVHILPTTKLKRLLAKADKALA